MDTLTAFYLNYIIGFSSCRFFISQKNVFSIFTRIVINVHVLNLTMPHVFVNLMICSCKYMNVKFESVA